MSTQYWINKGGKQSGPHTMEELQQMSLDSNTYVWCSGMDDWKKIGAVPSLAHLAAAPVIAEEPAEEAVEAPAEEVTEAPAEEAAPKAVATPPVYIAPAPPAYVAPAASEPCPPTNLVAAIVLTLLCCMPFGVAAIVMAVLVKKHYSAGDMEKAKKYSEWGAWCCILSMVLGILTMPLQFFLI